MNIFLQLHFPTPRHAETPECWNIEVPLDSICLDNVDQMIKLSANINDLSANMTEIAYKCREF